MRLRDDLVDLHRRYRDLEDDAGIREAEYAELVEENERLKQTQE